MTTRTRGRNTKEIAAEWSQEKIDRFIEVYPVMTNSDLMEMFGCKQAVLSYLRKKYHLSKDKVPEQGVQRVEQAHDRQV
jgi:hypothetical protein